MYLLDANVLIEAKNRYYAFDIAPGFWEWLDQAHRKHLACSIEAVRDELVAGDDELAIWAATNAGFFQAIDDKTTHHFEALSVWAASQGYTPAALSSFTGTDADYLLVAFAREHAHTVVTHERSQPQARRRVLIPDACTAMGVTTVDTFQMLRATGAQLVLHPVRSP